MQELINGVLITPLKIVSHPKGDIYHGMKRSDSGYLNFGEAYFSTIVSGETKAWKMHTRMTSNLIVCKGKVKIVLYDNRKDSVSNDVINEFVLSLDNYCRLTVPPGIWLGFKGIAKDISMILNIADIVHDPSEQVNISSEELNIKYNL